MKTKKNKKKKKKIEKRCNNKALDFVGDGVSQRVFLILYVFQSNYLYVAANNSPQRVSEECVYELVSHSHLFSSLLVFKRISLK